MNSLQDFTKSIPSSAVDIVIKARYLYLELGKRSYYDTQYKYHMFGEDETIFEYYDKPYRNPNIIICKTLAKQYSELLTLAGIRNRIANLEEDAHDFVIFYDEEGKEYVADITNDLKNIQFHCRTSYFYEKEHERNSQKGLEDIDKKLGYISEKRTYTDDYWHVVRDILVKNPRLSPKQKLEMVMQNLQKFGDITKPRGQ